MEFVKRYWLQVRAQLEGLSPSQKWLIGALLVIMLMAGFLLLQYAGQAERVPITGFAAGSGDAIARLQASGIDAEVIGGQTTVPRDQWDDALAILAQSNLLGEDAGAAFNNLVLSNQSPWQTRVQGDRAFLIAKQQVLGQIIRKMRGVASADVVVSMPQDQGFGKTFVRPTASVTVTMRGGSRVNSELVEAIAGLASTAAAEMSPQDVVVIDANHGRQHRVSDPADAVPSDAIELVRNQEEHYRRKISEVLRYIPGVIVAVTVRTDQVHSRVEEAFQYEDNEPVTREHGMERVSRNVQQAGEPGPRSNTGLDIAGGGGSGTEESLTETETEFGEKPLVLRSQTTLRGHMVRSVNVTINVPRGFFVQIHRANNPDAPEELDDAAIQPLVEQKLVEIERSVMPLITADTPGVVQVSMIPDETQLAPVMAGAGGATGLGMLMASDWAKPVGVTLLALVSLALMLGMVKKATAPESLPSIEELAGVPPTLPAEEDLVGEVVEEEASMAGVELDEAEIQSRRMAEQIGEMIKANPDEAGALLGKWVNREDY